MTSDNRPETTNHSVTFPLAWLKAIRNFSAKNDTKHYLNGVAISNGALVATDGYCLGAMLDARFDDLPQVIIPNDAVDTFVRGVVGVVKAWKHYAHNVIVRWKHTGDSSASKHGTLVLGRHETEVLTFGFVSETGKYLDYRRVLLPDHQIAYGHPHFDLELLKRFEKAAKELEATCPSRAVYITPKGDDGARVRLSLDGAHVPFEGVIMPIRADGAYVQPSAFASLDDFVYAMKARLVEDCVERREMLKWKDPKRFNEGKLSRMFHDRVAKDDKVGAANILMMLHKREEKLTSYDASQDLRKAA